MQITQWRTLGGKVIQITEMENSHLINAILHTRKNLFQFSGTPKRLDSLLALCYEAGRRNIYIDEDMVPPHPKLFTSKSIGEAVIPVVDTLPQRARARRSLNT